jgi:hypothetical protein
MAMQDETKSEKPDGVAIARWDRATWSDNSVPVSWAELSQCLLNLDRKILALKNRVIALEEYRRSEHA